MAHYDASPSAAFSSPQCRVAVREAHRLWHRSCGVHDLQLQEMQEVLLANLTTNPRMNLWYVRNQKVASTSIMAAMRRQLGWWKHTAPINSDGIVQAVLPYRHLVDDTDAPFPPQLQADTDRRNYVFTIVRDPFEAARSGYIEVSHRRSWSSGANASFLQLPCSHAVARYERFLRAVEAGDPLGAELFHAYPQALKLSAVSRFDRVLRLEGWARGEQAALLLRETGLDLRRLDPSRHHSNLTAYLHGVELDGCGSFDLLSAPALTALYCRLYAVDYECGLAPRPAECAADDTVSIEMRTLRAEVGAMGSPWPRSSLWAAGSRSVCTDHCACARSSLWRVPCVRYRWWLSERRCARCGCATLLATHATPPTQA